MSDKAETFNLLGVPAPRVLVGDPTVPPASVPSLEDAFAQPNLEDLFQQPKPLYSRIPLVDHFTRGFKHGFGEGISEDSKKWLRDSGILGPAEKRQQNIMQDFTERYLLGGAEGAYFGFRALQGAVYGVSEAMVGAGAARDLTPAALWEAFPAGPLTGFPVQVPFGRVSPTMERLLPRDTPPALDLDLAAELGMFGRAPAVEAREAFAAAPETLLREEGAPSPTLTTPSNAPQLIDIHTLAEQLSPELFMKRDQLVTHRVELDRWFEELTDARKESPFAKELQQRVDSILEPVNGVEERLSNRQQKILEERRGALEDYLRVDSPEMAQIRANRIEINQQLVDMSNEIKNTYREARRLMPEEVRAVEETPAVAPANVVPIRADIITDAVRQELRARGWMAEAIDQMSPKEANDLVQQPRELPTRVAPSREIRALAQRGPSIAADTAQRLVAAGRPDVEARAAGALVQARYEARAARMGGALGTARDLYEAESPRIAGATGTGRGRLILREARNTIQLMERADASTFLHESAHNWLEELRRDAAHEAAPPELKADMDRVKEWLGVEGALTREAHERFARGFERYLMEGQAPSSRLAAVFEKFKQWLTEIYQSVARLRAPITDDIRGVYDRLLSPPSREPVIAPERPGARTWAEDAMEAVRETPAADAAAKADQIAEQRERLAGQLRRALDERRREARRGPERTPVSDERGGEAGAEQPRKIIDASDDDLDAGRTPTAPKSDTPREGDSFGPTDRAFIDKAGNIRIDNLMVGEDVAEAIRQAAGEKTGFIEARRGVLSDVETLKLAEDIGVDPNKLDRWAIAEAWTAEQIVFARRLLRDSATGVRDAAIKLTSSVTEEGLVEYAVARERHMMIQERVSAVTAEAGRAMRAFRTLEGEKDTRIITTLLQQATGKSPGQLRREARLISALGTPGKINAQLSRQRQPTWGDMFIEGWINTLVSGPFTHIVNVSTNAGTMMGTVAESGAAAAVGRAFELAGRERGVTFGEVIDRAEGMGQGAVDGMRAFNAIIMDENKIPAQRSIDTRPMHAIPSTTVNIAGVPIRIGGTTVRLPGRFLSAEDEFFKAVAWQQEINVLARRAALNEGLLGDQLAARIEWFRGNPTESMMAAAEQFAQYQTFQMPLGRFGQALLNVANAHPSIRLILPFIRTPINLFKYAVERSPLGFLSSDVLANMAGRNGPMARDTQIGRMAIGNMVALGVGYLAYNGLVSGGGPLRAEEQLTLRMTGWQPYSFRVGDLWIGYRRFDPFSTTIGLAADLADLAKFGITGQDEFGKDADVERFSAMAVTTIWRNVIDKLSMRGVTSIAQVLTDPTQYQRGFVNGLVGSVVPGALAQTARLLDDYERDTHDFWPSLQARIPYAREEVLPRLNRWGEPTIGAEFGPALVSQANADPVNQTLLDLGINKAQPHRKQNGIEYTPQQYYDLVRLSGQQAKRMLDEIVTPDFRGLPKGVQVEVISKVIDSAREMGKAAVMSQSLNTDADILQKGVDLRLQFLETGHKR